MLSLLIEINSFFDTYITDLLYLRLILNSLVIVVKGILNLLNVFCHSIISQGLNPRDVWDIGNTVLNEGTFYIIIQMTFEAMHTASDKAKVPSLETQMLMSRELSTSSFF